MQCQVCFGKMEFKRIPYDLWIGKKLFVIKNVPAEVCDQCGETIFTPKTTEKILAAVKFGKSAHEMIKVPVLTLKHAV